MFGLAGVSVHTVILTDRCTICDQKATSRQSHYSTAHAHRRTITMVLPISPAGDRMEIEIIFVRMLTDIQDPARKRHAFVRKLDKGTWHVRHVCGTVLVIRIAHAEVVGPVVDETRCVITTEVNDRCPRTSSAITIISDVDMRRDQGRSATEDGPVTLHGSTGAQLAGHITRRSAVWIAWVILDQAVVGHIAEEVEALVGCVVRRLRRPRHFKHSATHTHWRTITMVFPISPTRD